MEKPTSASDHFSSFTNLVSLDIPLQNRGTRCDTPQSNTPLLVYMDKKNEEERRLFPGTSLLLAANETVMLMSALCRYPQVLYEIELFL